VEINKMATALQEKNDFVLDLREHFQEKYGTKYHYTFGEGDDEAEIRNNNGCVSYHLVKRDPKKPRDLSGFVFRKDLCSYLPQNTDEILNNVHRFAVKKGIESRLSKNSQDDLRLNLEFDEIEYSVRAWIGELYADEINIRLNESIIQKGMVLQDLVSVGN